MSWALVTEVTDTYDLFPFYVCKIPEICIQIHHRYFCLFYLPSLVYEPSERKCKSTDCPFPLWMAHRIKVTAACMVTSV